jgi:mRNA interferase MazF
MPPTTGYSFGDIVLVPFPFTDQSATKRRPAVIVSNERYDREWPDLIIMAVTSQAQPAGSLGEMQVKDWQAAGRRGASFSTSAKPGPFRTCSSRRATGWKR